MAYIEDQIKNNEVFSQFFPEIGEYYKRILSLYIRADVNFKERLPSAEFRTGMVKHQYDFQASMHNIGKHEVETTQEWFEEVKPNVYDWDTFRYENCLREIDEITHISNPV